MHVLDQCFSNSPVWRTLFQNHIFHSIHPCFLVDSISKLLYFIHFFYLQEYKIMQKLHC
jgi:hypothetical protein